MQRHHTLALFFCILLGNLLVSSQIKNDSIVDLMTFTRPHTLVTGDSIAIIAPSGVLLCKNEAINKAKQLAESWGLEVVLGTHVFSQSHHFAGTDEQRIDDFQEALDNPNIKAIWCARGGYGSVRIIDRLDFTQFKRNPKWIIGYSDITGLHTQINNLKIESIHGMMGTSMLFDLNESKHSIESLRKALFGEGISYVLKPNEFNKLGTTQAPVVGGNMTLLLTTLGSKTQLNVDGKILFIEEIGEYKYHIDRMLVAFKRAGFFDQCKGVIIGDMSNIKKNTTRWGSSTEQLILDQLSEYEFPVLFGFPAGHEEDNRALIFGRAIELSVTNEYGMVKFMK